MAVYVFVGGMVATTWVQVIKSSILAILAAVIALGVLAKFGFSLPLLFSSATEHAVEGDAIFTPGVIFGDGGTINLLSYALTFALGTAGMAHILIRFFTVPEAGSARRSLGWTVALCSMFYLIVVLMGFGAAAVLGGDGSEKVGPGGNLAAPVLVTELGGGEGTLGGSLALALVSAVAFASIVAVVAGVVISAAGTFARDVWPSLVRANRGAGDPAVGVDEEQQARVARYGAVVFSVFAIGITLMIGDDTNITYFMGMAFMVAGSAHLPALVLSLSWRRFTAVGARWGILTGLISTILTLMLTDALWMGSGDAPLGIQLPVIITLPLGLAACVLGSLLSGRTTEDAGHDDEKFAEMIVRAETGIGAEAASTH